MEFLECLSAKINSNHFVSSSQIPIGSIFYMDRKRINERVRTNIDQRQTVESYRIRAIIHKLTAYCNLNGYEYILGFDPIDEYIEDRIALHSLRVSSASLEKIQRQRSHVKDMLVVIDNDNRDFAHSIASKFSKYDLPAIGSIYGMKMLNFRQTSPQKRSGSVDSSPGLKRTAAIRSSVNNSLRTILSKVTEYAEILGYHYSLAFVPLRSTQLPFLLFLNNLPSVITTRYEKTMDRFIVIDDKKSTFQRGLCAKPSQKYVLPKAGKVSGTVLMDFETGSGDFDLIDTGVILEGPEETQNPILHTMPPAFFSSVVPFSFMVPIPPVQIHTTVSPSKRKSRATSGGKRNKRKKNE